MKIMLVEDEVKLCMVLEKGFKLSGIEMEFCVNGKKALDIITNDIDRYSIIIVDWMIPGINGIELCKELRKLSLQIPILFLTAKDSVGEIIEGLDSGADDYLLKPFDFRELKARVERLVQRPNVFLGDRFKFSNLEVDLKKRKVFRNFTELKLTKKEFLLLEFFIKYKGILLSKDMIASGIWPAEKEIYSNAIEAHIKNLRKKLNDKNEFIQTVPNEGYRFRA